MAAGGGDGDARRVAEACVLRSELTLMEAAMVGASAANGRPSSGGAAAGSTTEGAAAAAEAATAAAEAAAAEALAAAEAQHATALREVREQSACERERLVERASESAQQLQVSGMRTTEGGPPRAARREPAHR